MYMKSRFFLCVSGMLCLAVLSGCQREFVEPGGSDATKEVLTGFVFNISSAAGQQTKQCFWLEVIHICYRGEGSTAPSGARRRLKNI